MPNMYQVSATLYSRNEFIRHLKDYEKTETKEEQYIVDTEEEARNAFLTKYARTWGIIRETPEEIVFDDDKYGYFAVRSLTIELLFHFEWDEQGKMPKCGTMPDGTHASWFFGDHEWDCPYKEE